MQRFHGGSCTSAVNNSSYSRIPSRDTSRADLSSLAPNFSVNPRWSSQLAAYKLKCEKEELNSRLGPPDFHPQTPNCPEETLTKNYVQSGYKETVDGFEETEEILQSRIQVFTNSDIAKCKEAVRKCHRAINQSRAQKRKAGQVYGVPLSGSLLNKPGIYPEQKTCGEEFRKKWIEGLSQPHKRLRSLADHVPLGYKKKSLFEVLIRDHVPLLRATWFVKVIYLNQVRANLSPAYHDKSHVLCSEQWTKDSIEYLQHLLDEFMSRNHLHSNSHFQERSTQVALSGPLQLKGNSSSAVIDTGEPSLYSKWWYMVRIIHWHHGEGLMVPSLILDWVLNQLQEKDLLSVLQLLFPIVYGLLETVVCSQTYVRKLVGLSLRFLHEPSSVGSDLSENSRRSYAVSAVVEMLRFLILAAPDTFVALDCFPMPMVLASSTSHDVNLLSKLVEDAAKVNYGTAEVGVPSRRNHEDQAELFSFQSAVSSIQKRAETLSRAFKPNYPVYTMAKTVQSLDQALLSGDISVPYNMLFETCSDGVCAEYWGAEVSPCLLASLLHVRKISPSLLCSIFFVCEWATCEYRNFRAEPPHGLKFSGRSDVSQIFMAARLLKQKMNSYSCGQDKKCRETSNIFESCNPLHDAVVCWIDQHEVHDKEGFKRLQLLIRELIGSGIFNPLAYGRQLIVSGIIDGNGSVVELEKQKRHCRLLRQLPASYILDILEESQIADPSVLVEATNIYSNERRLILHGRLGLCKTNSGVMSEARRKKYHRNSAGSPSSDDQCCFQDTFDLSTENVDTKLEDIKSSVSVLLQLPPHRLSIDRGVDESIKRSGEVYNRISCNEDVSVCEECSRVKRQKLSEEHYSSLLLNPLEVEMWWVKKETGHMDSFKIEPPNKPSKQTPKIRQKSGRKTQSLAQLAAARIEGSQGASTSHVCESRIGCPHNKACSDDITKSVHGTMRTHHGDIGSVKMLLKHMRFSDKRKLMAWLVSVVKQLIKEGENSTTKINSNICRGSTGDDQSPKYWKLGEDELSDILFMMEVCNEPVLAAKFLFWLSPRVPSNIHIFSRNSSMFPKTMVSCDVGESFLMSSIRSYENIIVAADLIPEMLSTMMQRITSLLGAKGRLSGSAAFVYARHVLKKYKNVASVIEWEKKFRSTSDKRVFSELESSRLFEGDFGFNLGVPNGVEDPDGYFRQMITSARPPRAGMSMKEIVHRYIDEAFQNFYNKDRKTYGLGTNKNSSMENLGDGYHVAHQIVVGLMECMRNTGGAAQEGDPSLLSSAVAAIVNNIGLVIGRIPDITANNPSNAASSPSSLHFARHILRIHITCLSILKDALGERQSRVFEVALAMEASSTLLQALVPGKAPRSQFQMNPVSHDANANLPNEILNHSSKTFPSRCAKIFASVSALVIGCILQGVSTLDRMVALFRLKEGLDLVQFIRSLKSNVNGTTSSIGVLKADNLLEVSLNWFRVLVGNCKTVSDGLIVELLGEASIAALCRMQRSLTVNLVFPPAYCIFAFAAWKPILVATVGFREDFNRLYQSLVAALGDAIKHMPFREICFRDSHSLYDLMVADTLDRDFISLLESSGPDSNLKVSALIPLRSRLFLDTLIDCKIPEPVSKLDGGYWISCHGELKKHCGENVRKLMHKLVHVLDTLQPAKFHWQWVEIRLLLNEQAVNEKIMETDISLADAIRSVSSHPDKTTASENESNFVQIILTRLLVRPDVALLFSEAVRLLGKSLEDSMLSQVKWLLRGTEVLYGKKSIRQKITSIATELKELSLKSQYWKPWGWCSNTSLSPPTNKGEKTKCETLALEEGEVVDEGTDSIHSAKGNGLVDVEGFIVTQQHLTEKALIDLILPCLDQGSDDLRNNFASEMIKQISNIEAYVNAITHGGSKLPASTSPAIGSPGNKSSRKSGKSGSPVISRQIMGSSDSVPPSSAALRSSMMLRLQFLLRLLPVVCADRDPSTSNMRYALASVILRLLGSRVVYEDTIHSVNGALVSSQRNVESLMEASSSSRLPCGDSLFDSLLLVLHVLLSSYQPSWSKTKPESKSSNADYFLFDRDVAETMQKDLDRMEVPETIRWRIQAAMPIVSQKKPSSRASLSCHPPSLPQTALTCLLRNPSTSKTPLKNPVLPSRPASNMKSASQSSSHHDLDTEVGPWTLLEDVAGSGQTSPKSAAASGGSDHAHLKAAHWLKGAVRVMRTDLAYVGAVDDDS